VLKELLSQGLVTAPGVFDGFSAMMSRDMPFDAVYMSGYCVAASRYGLPDAGLIGLGEMIDAIRLIKSVNDKPLIADADTGYGGLLNVQHTVRRYEAAGASAIQLEDQEMPKKCGHTKGKRVVETHEMLSKIGVAVNARHSDDTLIIARTDSLATHGLDEAIKRCKAYRQAGADLVFVDALDSIASVERVGQELAGNLMINITPTKEFLTPEVSKERLQALGFNLAIYPGLFATPMLGAMEKSARHFLDTGQMYQELNPTISVHSFVGFDQVWSDEQLWSEKYDHG
jgi:2-methylisocitrate lyase-like PEP mutase family enzyme